MNIKNDDVKLTPSEVADSVRSARESVNPRIYVYRYMWREKDSDKIQLKIVSDVLKAHDSFRQKLADTENILSAMCEYVCEYDPMFISLVQVIKKEEKEVDKNEEIS